MERANFEKVFSRYKRFQLSPPAPEPVAAPKKAFVKPAARAVPPPPVVELAPSAPRLRLGVDQRTGQEISLAESDRRLGLYLIGQMGVGKSTLLVHLANQDIQTSRGVCVIDPHGDLCYDLIAQQEIAPERLVLIDSADWQHPFGLNLFECHDPSNPALLSRTVDLVMGIFRKLWGDPDLGVNIYELLSHVSQTFVEVQGYTLIDVPKFLMDANFRSSVTSSASWELQEFWDHYNRRSDQESYIRPTLNKIRFFSDHRILSRILGQSKSTLDFKAMTDQDKVLLLRLPEIEIGREGTRLIGMLMVNQLLRAMFARTQQSRADRVPFSLYCDEYQLFATADFAQFFTEGRKFAFQTVVAHQERSRLDADSKAATAVVTNKIAFRLSASDIPELRRWFDPPPSLANTTISYRPVQYLLEHNHPKDVVRAFIRAYLVPLQEVVDGLPTFDTQLHQRNSGYYNREAKLYKHDAEGALSRLFDLLNGAMSFAMHHPTPRLPNQQTESLKRIISFLYEDGSTVSRAFKVHGHLNEEMNQTWDDILDCLTQNADTMELERNLLDYCQDRALDPPLTLLRFVTALYWTCLELGQSPIREPKFNKQAYPEHAAKDDPAQLLANLPVGQALIHYSRDGGVYDTVLCVDPPQPGAPEVLASRLARARTYAQQHYTRSRSEVEREILRRQQQEGVSDDGPTRPRRVRRVV